MSAVLEHAVHTSAPEVDLFGEVPAANDATPRATCGLSYTGRLAHHAEVRLKQLDDHHYVPVVCLDLEHVGAGHHRLHAEQPFTEATRHEAEALAKRLRKGALVTVSSGLSDVRVFLPAATIFTT
jgi:hypothetical protein